MFARMRRWFDGAGWFVGLAVALFVFALLAVLIGLQSPDSVLWTKGAVGRRPRTWFRLTAEGRQAVEGHLAWLTQLEEAVSASTRDSPQARPLPGDRDQPHRVLPPLLGSS
jgi:hypothetical protein